MSRQRAGRLLQRLLHPPKWVLFALPPLSFGALAFIFVSGRDESEAAYGIYGLSAYSLAILCAAAPGLVRRLTAAFRGSRLARSELGGRYLHDLSFRGSVGIYQGMTVNFLYCIFRVYAGLRYASVWFLSMAAYYLLLGALRAFLVVCWRRRTPAVETRCYRRTAWLLFLLNIPMGGMIVQMVLSSAGYSYPGHIIYLSALYTFYAIVLALRNLVRYRRLGSPILSAAKVLNLVSALMSVLGLQTAMLAQFSENGEAYRRLMNAITGAFVYAIVILIAVFMLLRSRRLRKEGGAA